MFRLPGLELAELDAGISDDSLGRSIVRSQSDFGCSGKGSVTSPKSPGWTRNHLSRARWHMHASAYRMNGWRLGEPSWSGCWTESVMDKKTIGSVMEEFDSSSTNATPDNLRCVVCSNYPGQVSRSSAIMVPLSAQKSQYPATIRVLCDVRYWKAELEDKRVFVIAYDSERLRTVARGLGMDSHAVASGSAVNLECLCAKKVQLRSLYDEVDITVQPSFNTKGEFHAIIRLAVMSRKKPLANWGSLMDSVSVRLLGKKQQPNEKDCQTDDLPTSVLFEQLSQQGRWWDHIPSHLSDEDLLSALSALRSAVKRRQLVDDEMEAEKRTVEEKATMRTAQTISDRHEIEEKGREAVEKKLTRQREVIAGAVEKMRRAIGVEEKKRREEDHAQQLREEREKYEKAQQEEIVRREQAEKEMRIAKEALCQLEEDIAKLAATGEADRKRIAAEHEAERNLMDEEQEAERKMLVEQQKNERKQLAEAKSRCSCGHTFIDDSNFCSNCGAKRRERDEAEIAKLIAGKEEAEWATLAEEQDAERDILDTRHTEESKHESEKWHAQQVELEAVMMPVKQALEGAQEEHEFLEQMKIERKRRDEALENLHKGLLEEQEAARKRNASELERVARLLEETKKRRNEEEEENTNQESQDRTKRRQSLALEFLQREKEALEEESRSQELAAARSLQKINDMQKQFENDRKTTVASDEAPEQKLAAE